jgi:hypothetical protein
LKLANWFWRRFLKIFSAFLLFYCIFPWAGALPFVCTILNPLPKRWFVLSLVRIGPTVLKKSTGDQKNSLELSGLVSYKV